MPAFSTFSSNDDLSSGGDLQALSFLLVACVVAGLTSLSLSLMKEKGTCHHNGFCRHRVAYLFRWACFLTTYVIAIYGWARFSALQGWTIKSAWFESDDGGEKEIDSFAQLMPLALLALPVLTLIEALAERIVDAAGPAIKPGASVLDLATGTGKVALVAAAKVGEGGRVLGIDISDEFVGLARKAADEAGRRDGVEFLQRDVGALDVPVGYGGRWADAVTCGSAISMFAEPGKMLGALARDVMRTGGVFVADVWATHLPAKLFLDVAIPRGFEAPFDVLWLADTEAAFRRLFEGTQFELVKVEKAGESKARWEAGSEEKMAALWKNLAEDQT
ncbi:hypothetical protein PMIN07_000811 [Paraphaeosphaeria minitans]